MLRSTFHNPFHNPFHSLFHNPFKGNDMQRNSGARPGGGGPSIDYRLTDMAWLCANGVAGFSTKAADGKHAIVKPLGRAVDGQIQPLYTGEEFSWFYQDVIVADYGQGKDRTNFIANPSDDEDINYDDIPVVKLRKTCAELMEDPAGQQMISPYVIKWFTERPVTMGGKTFNKIGFPWPKTNTVYQVIAYRVPGCKDIEKIKAEHRKRLAPHQQLGYILAVPEYMLMFCSGKSHRQAIGRLFSQVYEDGEHQGELVQPKDFFVSCNHFGIQTGYYRDEESGFAQLTAEFVDLPADPRIHDDRHDRRPGA